MDSSARTNWWVEIMEIIRPTQKWHRYSTDYGICFNCDCQKVIDKYMSRWYEDKVQLVFTSPPFPLNRKKSYGNLSGNEYINWLCGIVEKLIPLLTKDGSLVVELGNAWNSGEPTVSTLPLETLLAIKTRCNLYLCQEFIYYNPAKLPGPTEWVNKRRIRVKDSFTRIWWFSKTAYPKANNSNVLQEYSKQMNRLLARGTYNSGTRPSEHKISKTAFAKNNIGSIPSNVIIASNTISNDPYLIKCKEQGMLLHPARMPQAIPEFFIKMLTDKGDLVFDIFAGSNTTGYCAEMLNRSWISCEIDEAFFEGSKLRFRGD